MIGEGNTVIGLVMVMTCHAQEAQHDAEWKVQTEATHKKSSIQNGHAHFPE
jgi:hypothetical protein